MHEEPGAGIEGTVDGSLVAKKMEALRKIGVPYTDEEIAGAAAAVEGKTELDAVVAKAAKKAGIEGAAAVADSGSDREKLIEELRAERDANEKAAAEAAQEAEAEEWLRAKRAAEEEGEAPAEEA